MRYSSSCPLLSFSSQPSALNSVSWPGNGLLLVYLVPVLPPSGAGAGDALVAEVFDCSSSYFVAI